MKSICRAEISIFYFFLDTLGYYTAIKMASVALLSVCLEYIEILVPDSGNFKTAVDQNEFSLSGNILKT